MLSDREWATIRFALRRSRLRVEVLLVLDALAIASLGDLSERTKSRYDKLLGALVGSGYYRSCDSLVRLKLVSQHGRGLRARFEITERGRFVAAHVREARIAGLRPSAPA